MKIKKKYLDSINSQKIHKTDKRLYFNVLYFNEYS